MSEQVIIEAVNDSRDWESPDGKIKNTFYTVVVKKGDGTEEEVDHARVTGGAEPEVGEELDVYFEPGKFRRRMKKEKTGAFAGSSQSSESSSQSSGGGGKPPDVQRQIIRQHSQEMALRTLALTPGSPIDGELSEVFALADLFDADVLGQAANSGQDIAPNKDSGHPSDTREGDTHSPAQTSPPAEPDASHRLYEDLDNAGVTDHAERNWLIKAFDKLPGERRNVCETSIRMGAMDAQAAAVAGLRKLAGPMPKDTYGDDIPF